MLTRKNYIALLAKSPSPKDIFDKKQKTIPIEPNSISNYDFAVLNGFKGGEDFYNQSVDAYIDGLANSPISKELYDKKNKPVIIKSPDDYQSAVLKGFKGSRKQYDAIYSINEPEKEKDNDSKPILETKEAIETVSIEQLEEVIEQIVETEQTVEKEKEVVNKRINDTNDKIEKVKTRVTVLENKKDIDITPIDKKIDDTNKKVDNIQSKVSLLEKKDFKPVVEPIIKPIIEPIDKKIQELTLSLDTKTTFEEVKDALSVFSTKQEIDKLYYNKLEIDSKFKKIKRGDISILGRGGAPGSAIRGMITGTLSEQTDLQSALDLKANLDSPTFTGTVVLPSTTSIGTVSNTEISYLDGVTSNIQTQLNAKESALTFSTGLTRATNTITSNLSTGVSGGQSAIGGTASGDNLTLSSTSHATKGKIIFGSASVYDEVNDRIGIGITAPAHGLDIRKDSGGSLFVGTTAGSTRFSVNSGGRVGIGLVGWIPTTNGGQTITTGSGGCFIGYDNAGDLAYGSATSVTVGRPLDRLLNATSGSTTQRMFDIVGNFSPTSGSALFVGGRVLVTVNQTGGANGITRGFYINPTITAAADFRALEISNNSHFSIYQSGASATNYFAGNTGFGVTTGPARLLHAGINTAGTSNVEYFLRFQRNTTGTAAAGLGIGQEYTIENASGSNIQAGAIEVRRVTATAGAEDADMAFRLAAGGVVGEKFRFSGTMLKIGGITSSQPALKGNGTGLESRLADDSAYSSFRCKLLTLEAGTTTVQPLLFTTGTNLTTPVAGSMEYNNTFHLTNSDATRRHIATAPNTTKVTAGAPYTNDGYIVINIGGTDFKVMTTA